jgi:hypothetical protein
MSEGEILIQLDENRTAFRPGEMIRGSVAWSLSEIPRSGQVRLAWNTAGKGTQNVSTVQTLNLSPTSPREQQRFEIRAPESPYSFSGRLVSLIWAIEVELEPHSHCARQEIVISPTGHEVDLYAAGEPL